MSRIAPREFEAVEATPRRSMTPARRRAVLTVQGPQCAAKGCERPWKEVDHRVALALGGEDAPANLVGLCGPCHLLKTLIDLKAIAKAKRLIARQDGARRERKGIAAHVAPWPPHGSRGFR